MDPFDRDKRSGYVGRAAAYERTFGRLCGHTAPVLLDALGPVRGERLLDVGCGPGTVSAAAAARGARVTAVDTEQSMVDVVRRRLPDAAVLLGALPRLPLADATADVATANFVINHVGDPRAALAELRRVLRPGGRIGVTIWPQPPTPLHQLWSRVAEAAQLASNPARLAPDKDFDRDPAGLAGLLTEAGFTDATCRVEEWVHRTDPEQWWSGPAAGLAEFGRLLAAQPATSVARAKRHYDELSAPFRTGTGELALPTAALVAVAAAP